MSDTPFIKFFPGDFLGGVGGLSPAERGVYITLLCLIWDGDGPISMDEARLARRCGMPKAAFQKALSCLIDEGKIIRTPQGLTNDRAEKTLVDRQNRVQNAINAVNSRWSAQVQKIEENQCEIDTAELPRQYADDTKPEARSQSNGGGGSACAREADFTDREMILEAMGVDPSGIVGPGKFTGTQADVAELRRWQALPGLTMPVIAEEIRRIVAAKPDGPPTAWKYFNPAMARLSAALTAPPLQPDARASPRPSSQPDLAAAFARIAARSNPQ